jgi:hypothetical protein
MHTRHIYWSGTHAFTQVRIRLAVSLLFFLSDLNASSLSVLYTTVLILRVRWFAQFPLDHVLSRLFGATRYWRHLNVFNIPSRLQFWAKTRWTSRPCCLGHTKPHKMSYVLPVSVASFVCHSVCECQLIYNWKGKRTANKRCIKTRFKFYFLGGGGGVFWQCEVAENFQRKRDTQHQFLETEIKLAFCSSVKLQN